MGKLKFLKEYDKIHFIGVLGVSMSGLAKYLSLNGKTVTGSDNCAACGRAKLLGVRIKKGHSAKNVESARLVVYSSAVNEDNPELAYARENNIPVIKRSKLLGDIMGCYKNSIAVSGSHGKTTTTAMLWEIFSGARKYPTVFLGGDYKNYGNLCVGQGETVIAEACEYKGNFLDIRAKISIVLNIDNDHLESFGDMDVLVACFKQFISGGISVVNVDDINARKILSNCSVTYGVKNHAAFCAKYVKRTALGYAFTFYAYGKRQARISLAVEGKHNVYNALAAATAAYVSGVSVKNIKRGLENFCGVARRNELLGESKGVRFVADYAHHPTEISAFLEGAKLKGEDYAVIFQPHTYSRTKLLLKEFIDVLKDEKRVIIYKTFAARESFDEKGSGKSLYEQLLPYNEGAKYAESKEDLLELIKEGRYKTLLFIGAGDIFDIAKEVLTSY